MPTDDACCAFCGGSDGGTRDVGNAYDYDDEIFDDGALFEHDEVVRATPRSGTENGSPNDVGDTATISAAKLTTTV